MSELIPDVKDWPVWAIKVARSPASELAWLSDSGYQYIGFEGHGLKYYGANGNFNHHEFDVIIDRPYGEEAPAMWNGEGRPPVGTVCEAQIPSKRYEWECCEIVWHHPDSDGSAAVVHGDGKLLSWSSTFRPIRTPEQIAAEVREAEIIEIERVAMAGDSHKTMAEALYDAGYRKQVAP